MLIIMSKWDVLTFLYRFIVVLLSKVKPVESSVKYTIGDAASTPVEEISDAEYFFRYFLNLQHLCEPFRKVIAVEVEQVIPISYVIISLRR